VRPGAADETAVPRPVGDEREDEARPARRESESEVTTQLPQPSALQGAADETAVLPQMPANAGDETTVLPQVTPGAAEETAVLPPVRGEAPADRVPQGFFRDERAGGLDGSEDRTREMPQIDADGVARRRPRPEWAEETPLDDLPSLADELLGSYDDQEYGEDEGRGRGRRS
jgi:dTMP kinase